MFKPTGRIEEALIEGGQDLVRSVHRDTPILCDLCVFPESDHCIRKRIGILTDGCRQGDDQ